MNNDFLTDKEILKKAILIDNIDEKFQFGIVEYLRREKCGDLYILNDFYEISCNLLRLKQTTGEYWDNKRKIQYRLNKLRNKKIIDSRRVSSGFMGKTDFGMTSLNCYTLIGFWN